LQLVIMIHRVTMMRTPLAGMPLLFVEALHNAAAQGNINDLRELTQRLLNGDYDHPVPPPNLQFSNPFVIFTCKSLSFITIISFSSFQSIPSLSNTKSITLF